VDLDPERGRLHDVIDRHRAEGNAIEASVTEHPQSPLHPHEIAGVPFLDRLGSTAPIGATRS
jgi:hypothetical protein